MHGVMDGVQPQLLGLFCKVHLTGSRAVLGLYTHFQILFRAVRQDLTQQLGKLRSMLSFFVSCFFPIQTNLRITFTMCHARHSQIHAHLAALAVEVHTQTLDDFRIDALGNTHNVLGSPSHFTFLLNKLGSRRLTDRAELRSSLTLVHITTNSANKLRHNLFPPALLYFCCFIERHCCRVYNISCFPIGVKYLLIKNINYF